MKNSALKTWVLIFILLFCCSNVFADQSPGIPEPAAATGKPDSAPAPDSPEPDEAKDAPAKSVEETAPDAAVMQNEVEPETKDLEGAKGVAPEKGVGESAEPTVDTTGPIKWENDNQKTLCASHLARLKENFLRARYHSIQGDSCVTAEYARLFLELEKTCEKECPKGLLERNGYTEKVIRNLNWLYKLGKERCLK